MKWLCRAVALAIVLSLSMASVATAQQNDRAERAQEAFDRGTEFYVQKEYGRAVAEFRKGHQLMPNGLFLYNIALTYIKLGDYKEALRYAERAQERASELPARSHDKNAGRIMALRLRKTALEAAEHTPARAAADPRDKRRDSVARSGAGMEEGGAESESDSALLSYVGAGTALAGAGLIVGATLIGQDVQQRIDTLAETADRDKYESLRAGIESDQSTGRILLFSGVGLVAAGSGLVAWDLWGGGDEARVSLRPLVGAPVGAQVRWDW